MTNKKGIFITFEGGEGVGKTTQIEKLRAYIQAQGKEVIVTREPGGTPQAEKIRDLIVRRDGGNWHAVTELLLFLAARNEHIETAIKPALARGAIVICDRFIDSTYAYQGYGRGQDIGLIDNLHRLLFKGFKPDLTFFLDLAAAEGLSRAQAREAVAGAEEDRFEQLDHEFHARVRTGYLECAGQDRERFHSIDASQSIEKIHETIIGVLNTNAIF